MDSAFADSTNHESKILGEKKSRKFQKEKPEFALCRQLFTRHLYCTYNYLHSIYIVLGIISNLEMIYNIWEDVHRLYATYFYIRDLSICDFGIVGGSSNQSPMDTKGQL